MIRISGGQWRGRNLPSPPEKPGLRPTTGRVRQSVFERLSRVLPGAAVLDLYAGSGLLGFEALSRGAAHVLAVESDARVAKGIRLAARSLMPDDADTRHAVWVGAVETLLRQPPETVAQRLRWPLTRFSLVLMDPPYARDDVTDVVAQLLASDWLTPDAVVVVEHGRNIRLPEPFEAIPFGDTVVSFRWPEE